MTVNAAEIRQMTEGEIQQALDDAREEHFNLRFQWESGQLEDYTRIRQVKKEIARYLTVLRERALAAEIIQQEGENA
jgi:large subunit ribosomal protein L29